MFSPDICVCCILFLKGKSLCVWVLFLYPRKERTRVLDSALLLRNPRRWGKLIKSKQDPSGGASNAGREQVKESEPGQTYSGGQDVHFVSHCKQKTSLGMKLLTFCCF